MHGRRALSLLAKTAKMARVATTAALCALGAGAVGCGGQASEPTAPALVFPGPPALTVPSASGQLSIALWWSPRAPTVGYDATQLAITDPAGAPVTGLTLTIVPFMPAHGHGASVQPAVSETAPGVYVATPLDFFMAGHWELMTAISRAAGQGAGDAGARDAGAVGAIDDSAEPTVDVP
ncbi:MAG TPA: FixH family protein [Polyangia bacterium]|nr:FixH family protein [Polyangia bacterium]